MRYSKILDIIGNTPIVEIKKANPYSQVKIFAKLEGFNPGGSVKDRIANLPKNTSLEKRNLIQAFGGKVYLTEGNNGTNGAIKIARRWVC